MKQPAKQTLTDLRPNATIKCFYCQQTKPQVGSVKFRAHLVCAECVQQLQTKGKEK